MILFSRRPELERRGRRFMKHSRRSWTEWGYFDVRGTLVFVPWKAGSMSFRFALYPELKLFPTGHPYIFLDFARADCIGPFTVDYARRDASRPKLLAVRDPVDRFASLWRDAQRRNSTYFKPLRGLRPDQLLEMILHQDLIEDGHCCPQSAWWFEGVELVRYDRLLERLGLPLEHRRRSSPALFSEPMPVDGIRKVYSQDVKLWNQVNS